MIKTTGTILSFCHSLDMKCLPQQEAHVLKVWLPTDSFLGSN
jgi:hypothetical protein